MKNLKAITVKMYRINVHNFSQYWLNKIILDYFGKIIAGEMFSLMLMEHVSCFYHFVSITI